MMFKKSICAKINSHAGRTIAIPTGEDYRNYLTAPNFFDLFFSPVLCMFETLEIR